MVMYAECFACCPLVIHVDYAPCVLLRLEKRWDGWTDGRTPDCYITLNC